MTRIPASVRGSTKSDGVGLSQGATKGVPSLGGATKGEGEVIVMELQRGGQLLWSYKKGLTPFVKTALGAVSAFR